MSELIGKIRKFLIEQNIDFLIVNATDNFLVEYNSLMKNSRYFLTNFTGSTGDALISDDNLYLFVDGRYHIQADLEVNHNLVSVVKLQTGQTFLDECVKKIKDNSTLGIFSRKNSQGKIEKFNELLKDKNIKIKLLDFDPIDNDFSSVDKNFNHINDDFNVKIATDRTIDQVYTGMSIPEKIEKITKNLLDNQAILITNPEEVSYLVNKRNFSIPYSANIRAKVIVLKNDIKFFSEDKLSDFDEFIKNFNGFIYVDKSSVNAYDYKLIENKVKVLQDSPIKLMKSIKTTAELAHYKEAFKKTDLALSAIKDYIENNENISEYDVAERLKEEYKKYGAISLSFKPIVATNKNSALAHYSKSSKDEIIKAGTLVLIDSGAYYEGGLATDITRVFVKGDPSKLQKKVYTTVLKMFLNAYNFKNNQGKIIGYDIDNLAREIYERNKIDGFDFNHGLGHGIGVSVHEYPPNLSKNEQAKVEIMDGMCFTIEPGLYNARHFGVRLENSCYMENGKIYSFVKMNYEKKLIDYELLTVQEKIWLKDFEVK